MMARPLVIYHADCADGFGAAWCFWERYRESADYVPGRYNEPPPPVAGRAVYLVDFSYRREVVAGLIGEAYSVILIDHHASALADLADLPGLEIYPGGTMYSGAVMAWHYTHDGDPPELLAHIQDRDLWRFQLDGTREVVAALYSYPFDFDTWTVLMAAGPQALRAEGAALVRNQARQLEQLIPRTVRYLYIAGQRVPVANLPPFLASDAGNILATGEAFAATYWDAPDARHFSLRSAEGGADVAAIARQYGGGGHVRAAGFKVARNHDLAMV